MPNKKTLRYFQMKEFDCPDCGENKMNEEFLERLDKAREYAVAPFVISSGYRCKSHNEAVGGSLNSSHMKGLAADIVVRDSRQRYKILMGLIGTGFNRIGINSKRNFIHVDLDTTKPPNVIWIYD